jgi:Uma2 family endonuclease
MALHIQTTAPVALESGDHLTRDEFHRRYLARPDIKKAELIDGVVFVASPVRFDAHAEPHAFIMGWLASYVARHRRVRIADNGTVLLGGPDGEIEVQPDAFLWRDDPDSLHGPRVNADGYIEGAPQLVVEVAASSASYDLHVKRAAYERNGVQEYIVWRVLDGALDWFRLHEEGTYTRVETDGAGLIESTEFPGLRLHVPSMLAGDLAAVIEHLRAAH